MVREVRTAASSRDSEVKAVRHRWPKVEEAASAAERRPMFFPAMGFLMGCIVFFAMSGLLLPLFRFTLEARNIVAFILGAFPGTLVAGSAYGWIFADEHNQLAGWAVPGFFATMFTGAASGGLLVVYLKTRFRNK